MYRIGILDDEYLTCLGLKEAVPWESISVEVAFTCMDGKKGLELIKKEKPDIVLTDIRMPGMTGVDLVKELRKDNFEGEVIVLTAYKEFDYAVETYRSGIFAYLLKPVDNDELLKVVSEAIGKLKEKRKEKELRKNMEENESAMEASFFYQILHNITNDEFIKEEKKFSFKVAPSGILFLLKKENKEDEYPLSKAGSILFNALKQEGIDSLERVEEHAYILFIDSSDIEKTLSVLLKALSLVEDETDVVFTGALSSYTSPLEIARAYRIDKECIRNKMYYGFNTIEIEKKNDISYRHYVAIQDFYRILSEHYQDDLTVSSVSLMMNVSDSYLMHLLKKALGKTFNDILTDYRISLAKKLLKEGKYRINEIADKVGYNDEKYFSRVFKKRVGVSPSEYPE